MNKSPKYNNYDKVKRVLHIHKHTEVLKILEHPNSLNQILQNGNIIKIVGNGPMKTPGYPSGNQSALGQKAFIVAVGNQKFFPVFHELLDGTVFFLGAYRFEEYNFKMAFSGFRYYEYTLHKIHDIKVDNFIIY